MTVEELSKLYNTMLLIETKGESTKHMAICLDYLAALINRLSLEHVETEAESGD